MSKPFITAETKVVDVLEYGQGDDGEIAEIFKAFKQFRDGYMEKLPKYSKRLNSSVTATMNLQTGETNGGKCLTKTRCLMK